jgi:hypothetical protein
MHDRAIADDNSMTIVANLLGLLVHRLHSVAEYRWLLQIERFFRVLMRYIGG